MSEHSNWLTQGEDIQVGDNYPIRQLEAKTRPPYYNTLTPYEPWKIINFYKLDFYIGNVLKYILRAGKKDKTAELLDYEKAREYIDEKIRQLRYDLSPKQEGNTLSTNHQKQDNMQQPALQRNPNQR